MTKYSIKDLEHISGIKAHTLRIWEQRYNFINPKRTDTNIRYYNGEDLKLVLNISLLKNNGFKISKIAKLTSEEISSEVARLTQIKFQYPEQIQALTLSMLNLDEERFEKAMATSILQLGLEKAMLSIVYPFLSKIGVLWQTGAANPAHEHFITNLIRQKLIVAIDGQFVNRDQNSKKFLLYLPQGEMHEMGLLFANYIIKSRNHQVVYLGQNLPFVDLEIVYYIHRPDFLVTVITNGLEKTELENYLNLLTTTFPETKVLISGQQVISHDLNFPANIQVFPRKDLFIEFIEEL